MRHRFHSLCPYFAMFPETFVETWVNRLTKPGAVVLDPFCGRGTAPFQSLLMGRRAVAADVNPVAYCITRAKTNAPARGMVWRRINQIERAYNGNHWETARRRLPEFFHYAYRPSTLRQMLFLRDILKWQRSDTDCMIAALVLGSLHGESKRSENYLSNQMPRTISTKPAYSVRYWREHGYKAPDRDVFELLRNRVDYRYSSARPANRAVVFRTDMRELPRLVSACPSPIRCVITSPPYLNVTNFEEDQWLRLWFLGGSPHPTYHVVSRDDRHENPQRYWELVSDVWRMLGSILGRRADIVIRLGGKNLDPTQMGKALQAAAVFSKRRVSLVHTEISEIKRRQTDSFRPGSRGCRTEVDFHLAMA